MAAGCACASGGVPIRRELFRDILKVGAVACLSPLQSVTTMLLMAGFVAQLGVLPLAGFAIGQRLEFLMSTVAFGIGLASVPMVGMAIGAGDVPRARRVAWTAAGVTAAILGAVGLGVALFPDLWVTIFTRDPQVLGYGRLFLHWAGPGFAFFGIGLTLYFASQGAGRMAGPVFAATMRLLLVAVGGSWLVAHERHRRPAVRAERRGDGGLRPELCRRIEAGPLGRGTLSVRSPMDRPVAVRRCALAPSRNGRAPWAPGAATAWPASLPRRSPRPAATSMCRAGWLDASSVAGPGLARPSVPTRRVPTRAAWATTRLPWSKARWRGAFRCRGTAIPTPRRAAACASCSTNCSLARPAGGWW